MTLMFYRVPVQRDGSEAETKLPLRAVAGRLALMRDDKAFPVTIEDADESSPTVRLLTIEGAFIASRAVVAHVMAAPD